MFPFPSFRFPTEGIIFPAAVTVPAVEGESIQSLSEGVFLSSRSEGTEFPFFCSHKSWVTPPKSSAPTINFNLPKIHNNICIPDCNTARGPGVYLLLHILLLLLLLYLL